MRNIIIGTAGHIDHGKTTLIKNLTGFETDTLPEEIKRGMTINLGFAYYTLSNGKKIGVIDVPGHEKFIKNMVAGSTGIDFILLIIACDDGIMPQTIEHANICSILGVKKGMIVLTKRDLVSSERVEEIRKDIKERFKETFLANFPIVEVSSKDPSSYEHLKQTLNLELEKIELETEAKTIFRMSIDRVFSVKGFGTVVTGTTISGVITEGDTVVHYPTKRELKVKGIQNHGIKVQTLDVGNRCALNLHGIDVSEIKRGDILSSDKSLSITDRIDCLFTLLNKEKKIKNNSRIRLHMGTTEVIGRMKILELEEITGSIPAFVQLELENPVVAVTGDLGVIRSYSPLDTLGGVKVLNPKGTKVKKRDIEYLQMLNSLAFGNNDEKIITYLDSKIFSFPTVEEMQKDLTISISETELQKLLESKKIYAFTVGKTGYISRKNWDQTKDRMELFLKEYHEKNPLKVGISRSELKNKQFNSLSLKEFNNYLTMLLETGLVEEIKEQILLKGFKPKLNKTQKLIKDQILTIYKSKGFKSQNLERILEENGITSKNREEFLVIHSYLVETNLLIPLANNIFVMRGFYLEAEKLLREHLEKNLKITLKDYRDILNVSRSDALIFLEKFDTVGVTKRVDDYRVTRNYKKI